MRAAFGILSGLSNHSILPERVIYDSCHTANPTSILVAVGESEFGSAWDPRGRRREVELGSERLVGRDLLTSRKEAHE
jgi:hypothetical protein